MLEQEYKKVINFLNTHNLDYLVIGGVAVSVIGNPRETRDIDFCIFIKKSDVKKFLEEASKSGFEVDSEKMFQQAKATGCFHITSRGVHIDFLIASHKLESDALVRKTLIEIHGVKAFYPTPEDLILLKIIPGRLRDVADAQDIAIRYSGKLDKKYLLEWAQKLSDEAEDMRIYREVVMLLKL